jgi:hypothetical protein
MERPKKTDEVKMSKLISKLLNYAMNRQLKTIRKSLKKIKKKSSLSHSKIFDALSDITNLDKEIKSFSGISSETEQERQKLAKIISEEHSYQRSIFEAIGDLDYERRERSKQ